MDGNLKSITSVAQLEVVVFRLDIQLTRLCIHILKQKAAETKVTIHLDIPFLKHLLVHSETRLPSSLRLERERRSKYHGSLWLPRHLNIEIDEPILTATPKISPDSWTTVHSVRTQEINLRVY